MAYGDLLGLIMVEILPNFAAAVTISVRRGNILPIGRKDLLTDINVKVC